ncbi:MAG: hypothetical protein AUH28_19960 [Acidobacteria bacterium 13_1_40CM_56_16]|nr:MAG: hypothetical protein AUH28_19960 [Acidobacteria bacterium 13_1_40CM_56_16]
MEYLCNLGERSLVVKALLNVGKIKCLRVWSAVSWKAYYVNLPGVHAEFKVGARWRTADLRRRTATPTGATSTALLSSKNPSTYGDLITFTATVTPTSGSDTPTGNVTFFGGATTLGSGTLASGQATYVTSTLGGGSHSITATYEGDSTFGGCTSPPVLQTLNKAATSTTLSSNANPSTFG